MANGANKALSNVKPFRFLDLCPELRNKIYETFYEETCRAPDAGTSVDISDLPRTLPAINLTLASRQIHFETSGYYKEAVDHFWQANNFTFNPFNPWPRFLDNLEEMYMRSDDTASLTAISRRVDQLVKLDIEIGTKPGTCAFSVSRLDLEGVKTYCVSIRDSSRPSRARPRKMVPYSDHHVGMLDLMARWFVDYHGVG